MTTAQILRKAAELLDERGWCRGRRENDRGQLCIAGALSFARFGTARRYFGEKSSQKLIRLLAFSNYYDMTDWNDGIARDKRTVTRRLRAAAKRLEAK